MNSPALKPVAEWLAYKVAVSKALGFLQSETPPERSTESHKTAVVVLKDLMEELDGVSTR